MPTGSPSPARHSSLVVAALMLLAGVAPLRAETPVFTVEPDTIRADSTGNWRASVRVQNRGDSGLYPDSLNLEWRSLDEEPSAAAHQGVTSLTTVMHVMSPAGPGDTTGLDWTAPADFERGTLRFRLYAHDAKKQAFALESSIVVAGSDLYDLHPRAVLEAGGRKVEVVQVAPVNGPAPGVLYVPPAGVSARMALRWARQLASLNFAVEIMSLPGTGGTSGPADHAGPTSVAAVEAALAHLARSPGVDGKRLAVWGLGDGASTALLAAVRHPELLGVVAQNADYAVSGPAATRITSPVLVLHAASTGATSIAAAESFMVARAGKDLPGESRIEGGAATTRPAPGVRRDALRVAMDFLARRLRTP
jgi:hypothetical protein